MELILKAKDIRVEFKGRTCLDIDELEVYDYDRIGLVGLKSATPFPKCYLHKEKWTFDS